MDIQMPEMDGLEASRAIRTREKQSGRHVPILAMTAHAMKGDRERCLAAGMDDYVSKPIRAERLYEKIRSLLRRLGHRPRAVEVERRPDDSILMAARSAEKVELPAGISASGIDWKLALRSVGGRRRLLCEVVDAFRDQTPRLVEMLHEGLAEGNAAQVHRAAHTIKGSLRYFGCPASAELAAGIEMAAGEGQLAELEPRIDELSGRIDAVLQEMEAHAAELAPTVKT
jgi:HPt (histidine-containing phosphotransfer) domain-containing protein